MSLTTDPKDPGLREIEPSGQQKVYLILSEQERARGFVMPVHRSYTHLKCGGVTSMGLAVCETYARDPKFYGGTFCSICGQHIPLIGSTQQGVPIHNFEWPDGSPVGATHEESEAILRGRSVVQKLIDEARDGGNERHGLRSDSEFGGMDQLRRRQEIQDAMSKSIDDAIETANRKRISFDSACTYCRGLSTEKLKHDCDWRYGLIVNQREQIASCPKCGIVLAEWER